MHIATMTLAPPSQDAVVPTLRKVPGPVSSTAFLLCLIECAERASYFGVRTVFSNFIQFPLPVGGNGAGAPRPGTQQTAGALDRGLQFSNAFTLLFQFLVCTIPVFGGWLADAKLGRYNVVVVGVWIGALSHVLMVTSAVPSLLQAGTAIAPFMISFFLLAFGTGLFKPNIVPMIVDQYHDHDQRSYTKVLDSGECVVVDPETTIQRIVLICYGLVNVGALAGIPAAFSAKKVGFWLAFLVPALVYLPVPLLLALQRSKISKAPARGSELSRFFKIIATAVKRNKGRVWARDFWDAAKPSVWNAQYGITTEASAETAVWTDRHVDEVRRTISTCQIFLLFPLYNLNDGGVGSVLTSQAASMTTNGAPNDLLGNINPIVIIIATPILTHVIYPLLNYHKIRFGPAKRLTLGFTLAWVSGILGAIVQWRVYETSPCRYYATGCDIGTGVSPLSVWWQVPTVALGALSECFCFVTAYELAYARAPKNMKAIATSILLFSNALSSVLGLLITPAITDPNLIWIWAGPAVALFIQTCWFQWRFQDLDHDDYILYDDDDDDVRTSSHS
ncbi:POT family-domain-containing protein [Xylariaceae sp. FL1651]|nr:POT family-domain-containing protein [Xylariaceae sp. FL1651]